MKTFIGLIEGKHPKILKEVPESLNDSERSRFVWNELKLAYTTLANIDDHPPFMLYISDEGEPGFTGFTDEYIDQLRGVITGNVTTEELPHEERN